MSILRNNQMDSELQQDLAEYGLFRQKVKDGAVHLPKNEPYFGASGAHGSSARLVFPKHNVDELDNQYGVELAQFVPTGTGSYDMLAPAQFGKALSMKNPTTIKNYLRKLLESI